MNDATPEEMNEKFKAKLGQYKGFIEMSEARKKEINKEYKNRLKVFWVIGAFLYFYLYHKKKFCLEQRCLKFHLFQAIFAVSI